MHPQFKIELGNEAAKALPPIAVNVLSRPIEALTPPPGSDPLQHWVFVGTLAYLALQAAWLLWKWWKAYRTKGWSPRED